MEKRKPFITNSLTGVETANILKGILKSRPQAEIGDFDPPLNELSVKAGLLELLSHL
jgi:hypothetical protein